MRVTTLTNIQSWLIVFSAASFVFLINITSNLNALIPYLMLKLNLNTSDMGLLFASYYYSNFIVVLWAGLILDKVSTRKILLISYFVANCSILIFTLTSSLTLMVISRLTLGFVGSFSMISCFKLIKQWFPSKKITLVTGLATTYATLGILFSQTPLVFVIEKLGIKMGLYIEFGIGVLFYIIAIITIQDSPAHIKQLHSNKKIELRETIKIILTNSQNWIIGIYALLTSLPGIFFSVSWGIVYLQEVKNFSKLEGSYIISANILGNIIGSILIGWIATISNSFKTILNVCNILIIIILMTIIYMTKLPLIGFMALFFLFGISLSSALLIFPLTAENNHHSYLNAATGFVSTIMASGGICIQLLAYLIKDYKIDHIIINHQLFPILVLLIAVIVGFLLSLYIKRNPP